MAPGQGYAGLRSGHAGRSDAGNDLIADAGFAQRFEFLLEPAKDAGIAGLQPHHARASRGIVDQQAVDVMLLGRRPPGPFPHRNEIGAGTGEVEDRARGEVVKKHDIGLAQPGGTPKREKLGVAGTGGDEGDKTAHRSSAIRWKNVPDVLSRREPVSATTAPVASRTTASGVSGCAMIVE